MRHTPMQAETTNRLIDEYGVYATHMRYRLIPVYRNTNNEARRQIIDLR